MSKLPRYSFVTETASMSVFLYVDCFVGHFYLTYHTSVSVRSIFCRVSSSISCLVSDAISFLPLITMRLFMRVLNSMAGNPSSFLMYLYMPHRKNITTMTSKLANTVGRFIPNKGTILRSPMLCSKGYIVHCKMQSFRDMRSCQAICLAS